MQKFFTDKSKLFECNISVDGAKVSETKARLVLEFENNRNLLFHGKINSSGKCEILVPALKELNESKGKATLEVIAEQTFFESWNDKFELVQDKSVVVEVFDNEKEMIVEDSKPHVAVMITEDEVKEDPIITKFGDYVNENNVNLKLVTKSKDRLLKLLREYKSFNNASSEDIMTIVEELQKPKNQLNS